MVFSPRSCYVRVRAQFVVEEIMNDSILIALETYGLVGAQGEGSEAELNTDMNEMIAVRATLEHLDHIKRHSRYRPK